MRHALFAIVFSLSIALVLGFGQTPRTPDPDPEPAPTTYDDYDYDPQAVPQRVGGGSCPIARYSDQKCQDLQAGGTVGGFYETYIAVYNCEQASFAECLDNRVELHSRLTKNEELFEDGKSPENDRDKFWPRADAVDGDGPYWGITQDNAKAMLGTRESCSLPNCDPEDWDKHIKPYIDGATAGGLLIGDGDGAWNSYDTCNWYRPKVYTKRYGEAGREDVCMMKCNGCLTPEERLPGAWKHNVAPLTFAEYRELREVPTQRELDALYRCVPCRQDKKQMIHTTAASLTSVAQNSDGVRYTDCFPEDVLSVGVTEEDNDPNINPSLPNSPPKVYQEDVYECIQGTSLPKGLCKRLDRIHQEPNNQLSQFPGEKWFPGMGDKSIGRGWEKGTKSKLVKWLKCPLCGEDGNPEKEQGSTWWPSDDNPTPTPPGDGCPEWCRTSPEKRIGCAGPGFGGDGDPFCVSLSAPGGKTGYNVTLNTPIYLGTNLSDCNNEKLKEHLARYPDDNGELEGSTPDEKAISMCPLAYVRVLSAELNEKLGPDIDVGNSHPHTHVKCTLGQSAQTRRTCTAGEPGEDNFDAENFYSRTYSCEKACYEEVPAGYMPTGTWDGNSTEVNPGRWPGTDILEAKNFTRDPAFNLYRQFEPLYWPGNAGLTSSEIKVKQTSEKCNSGNLAYPNDNHIQSREHRRDPGADDQDAGERLCESSWYPIHPDEARTDPTITQLDMFRRCKWVKDPATGNTECRRREDECIATQSIWELRSPPSAPPPAPPAAPPPALPELGR